MLVHPFILNFNEQTTARLEIMQCFNEYQQGVVNQKTLNPLRELFGSLIVSHWDNITDITGDFLLLMGAQCHIVNNPKWTESSQDRLDVGKPCKTKPLCEKICALFVFVIKITYTYIFCLSMIIYALAIVVSFFLSYVSILV